jgi:hypothetical protein
MDDLSLIESLEDQLAQARQRVETLQSMLVHARQLAKGVQAAEPDPAGPVYAGKTITDAAELYIREAGPTATRALALALRRRGVKSGASNWVNTVFAALHKDGRFVHKEHPEGGKNPRLWELKPARRK